MTLFITLMVFSKRNTALLVCIGKEDGGSPN